MTWGKSVKTPVYKFIFLYRIVLTIYYANTCSHFLILKMCHLAQILSELLTNTLTLYFFYQVPLDYLFSTFGLEAY